MKILPYLRFAIVCLLGYNYYSLITIPSGDGIIDTSITVSNGIAAVLLFTFIIYLIIQGVHELKGGYLTAKWLRYYAILFEVLYIATVVGAFIINDYYSPRMLFIWFSSFVALAVLLIQDIILTIKLYNS